MRSDGKSFEKHVFAKEHHKSFYFRSVYNQPVEAIMFVDDMIGMSDFSTLTHNEWYKSKSEKNPITHFSFESQTSELRFEIHTNLLVYCIEYLSEVPDEQFGLLCIEIQLKG